MLRTISFQPNPAAVRQFTAPSAQAGRPPQHASLEKTTPHAATRPAFGLTTASFAGKTGPAMPVTPKLDMSKPPGQRLNILA